MTFASIDAARICSVIAGVAILLSVVIGFMLTARHRYVSLQMFLGLAIIGGVVELWLASRKGEHVIAGIIGAVLIVIAVAGDRVLNAHRVPTRKEWWAAMGALLGLIGAVSGVVAVVIR